MLVPGLLCDERLWSHRVKHLPGTTILTGAEVTVGGSIGGMA